MTSTINVNVSVKQDNRRETIGGSGDVVLQTESEYTDILSIGTSEELIAFPQSVCPVSYLFARNLDSKNYVSLAKRSGDNPFARLHPVAQSGANGGLYNLIPLHPNVTGLSLKANTAPCLVQLRALKLRNDAAADFGWGKWGYAVQTIFDCTLSRRIQESDLSEAEIGDEVRKILDFSHLANNSEQITAANRATLANDGDNDPSLSFDGSNDTYPLVTSPAAAGRTTFWVLTTPAAFASDHVFHQDEFSAATIRHSMLFLTTSGDLRLTARRVSGDAAVSATKSGVSANTKYVIVSRVNYTTGAVDLWLSGGAAATATIGSTGNSSASALRSLGHASATRFGGKINFFADFAAALSDADVNEIANYLDARFSSPGWTDI